MSYDPKTFEQARADIERRVARGIEELGFSIFAVASGDSTPSFAYTVGMTDRGHPELIANGIACKTSGAIVHRVATDILSGTLTVPSEGGRITGYATVDLWLKPVVDKMDEVIADFPLHVCHYVQSDRPMAMFQLVYPDAAGRWPWDDGYTDFGQVNLW